MPDLTDVLAALAPDEPDYPTAAALGPEALPQLAHLAAGEDTLLASKAVYLTGLIGGADGLNVIMQAVRSPRIPLRLAAAATLPHLDPDAADTVARSLVTDVDPGVQRVTLTSLPARVSAALREQVGGLAVAAASPANRALAQRLLVTMDHPG